jgi:trk system potassium uptake protein TrkH
MVVYRNKLLEKFLIAVNVLAAAAVAASFAMLFGFHRPLLPARILYCVQFVLLCVFVAEKAVRCFNATSAARFLRANWFEIPLLAFLAVSVFTDVGRAWSGQPEPVVRHTAVGVYLVLQVVVKLCRTVVALAAAGRNPTQILIASFVVLIVAGSAALSLPKASTGRPLGYVDALFTSTSATCVTGLVVKDTGRDFTLMGQIIILSLIQLGGLGIVVFGAVFALLLGQALGLRGSVAMQDLLSASALGRLTRMIAFIFFGTIVIETAGALCTFGMWDDVPGRIEGAGRQWFCAVFHSISAFCNAGFSLFDDSLVGYSKSWPVYAVICPLIILGGLGFGVLYDLVDIAADRVKAFFAKRLRFSYRVSVELPAKKRLQLQTKVVLTVSAFLVVAGLALILLLQRAAGPGGPGGFLDALFTSVTARTAGFNTLDVGKLAPAGRVVTVLLMFIGGSPGSTAGGIKTVTLAVLVMTVVAALRKRQDVELFRRSVNIIVVGRALTVTMLFAAVLLSASLALAVTERSCGFALGDIAFEAASALGTVGLSAGITGSLTNAGKLIIIAVMLIGRLGPLTLLALVTFNLKPARYNYPQEALIVG